MPSLFTLNDQTLKMPALDTIHQILTSPSPEDKLRREKGQQFIDDLAGYELDLDADFPFASPATTP